MTPAIEFKTEQKTRSVLHIVPGFSIRLSDPRPHPWFRLWQRLLLGWTWSEP